MTARMTWGSDWQGSKWLWPATRRRLKKRDGGVCIYCFDSEDLSIDHVDPTRPGKSKRGDNSPTNLITACMTCNRKKARRSLEEWAQILGPLTGQDPADIIARVKQKLAEPLPPREPS